MSDQRDPAELDYRSAGVDIDAGDAVVAGIAEAVRRTQTPAVLGGLGHFGGFFRIGAAGPAATLVASIDGVGTKLKVAALAGRHAGVGHDIVNHCVNDILACGARPLFFLDYFATGKLDPAVAIEVIGGIASACEALGVALLGGETAEMPGIYGGDDYDLAGVIVGLVDEAAIIDGHSVQAGDVVIGLPSSGFHTNGYSLIRTALGLNRDETTARARLEEQLPFETSRTLGEALLTPHRPYLADVASVLDSGAITGMAHITGGGLAGNLSRVIPDGLRAEVDAETWQTPEIFNYVAEVGHISEAECYRVFNMGIGFVLVVRESEASAIASRVEGATVIGRVVEADDGERVRLHGVEG